MKNLAYRLALAVVLLTAISATVYTVTPNSKVTTTHTATYLQQLTPDQIEYLNYVSDKGFHVHEGSKGENHPLLSTVVKPEFAKTMNYGSISEESFNPYQLTVQPAESHLFYQIDGTDKVLQLYSHPFIAMKFDQYLTTKKNKEKLKN